jgi:hypothetical protein
MQTTESYLSPEQIRRVVALREAATMGRDVADTVLLAHYILTGTDTVQEGPVE